jgi:hypothetical protein
MHTFQKQLDFVMVIVSSYLGAMILKYFLPAAFKLLVYFRRKCQCMGEEITNFVARIVFVISWMASRDPADPDYHVEFESNVEKLSSYIARTVPASRIEEFDDDHFAQHGRVYIKLFQIVRCMKSHSQSMIIDSQQKRSLWSKIESMEAVMKNYRLLPPSQVAHAYHEVSKLKSLFENV